MSLWCTCEGCIHVHCTCIHVRTKTMLSFPRCCHFCRIKNRMPALITLNIGRSMLMSSKVLSGATSTGEETEQQNEVIKGKKFFVEPEVRYSRIKGVKTVIGITWDDKVASWVQMDAKHNVVDLYQFTFPSFYKRDKFIDFYKVSEHLVTNMPSADIYCLETGRRKKDIGKKFQTLETMVMCLLNYKNQPKSNVVHTVSGFSLDRHFDFQAYSEISENKPDYFLGEDNSALLKYNIFMSKELKTAAQDFVAPYHIVQTVYVPLYMWHCIHDLMEFKKNKIKDTYS